MPRYAILEHDAPRGLHWDLMLQHGDVLRTWALAQSPDTPGELPAEALPDHRPAYLDYEGPVSGGRGEVRRWDHGTYEIVELSARGLVVQFRGQRLSGPAEFVAPAADASPATPWIFRLSR